VLPKSYVAGVNCSVICSSYLSMGHLAQRKECDLVGSTGIPTSPAVVPIRPLCDPPRGIPRKAAEIFDGPSTNSDAGNMKRKPNIVSTAKMFAGVRSSPNSLPSSTFYDSIAFATDVSHIQRLPLGI
jgi:hypothetical protein